VQHSPSTVVIIQLSLLRELEDVGIQLVSHGQANVQLSVLTLQPSIAEEIRVNQKVILNSKEKQNLEKGSPLGL